jgi:hypothetical protein
LKFGIRVPSLSKRIAARTSPARAIRHRLGLKAPRGAGWITDPGGVAYNRLYSRTTIDATKSGLGAIILFAIIVAVVAFMILGRH